MPSSVLEAEVNPGYAQKGAAKPVAFLPGQQRFDFTSCPPIQRIASNRPRFGAETIWRT